MCQLLGQVFMESLPVHCTVVPVRLGHDLGYTGVDDSVDRHMVSAWTTQVGGGVTVDEQPCEILQHEDVIHSRPVLCVHGPQGQQPFQQSHDQAKFGYV